MQTDFNNLRRKLVADYNRLIVSLNRGLDLLEPRGPDRVIVSVSELQKLLDNLRDDVVTIGCLYDDNDPDCTCVLDDDTVVKSFNSEDEDGN